MIFVVWKCEQSIHERPYLSKFTSVCLLFFIMFKIHLQEKNINNFSLCEQNVQDISTGIGKVLMIHF